MRFLSIVRIDENSGLRPSPKLMADMGKLMEELTREGKLVNTAGLMPTAEGTRIRLSGGKLSVVDGPFTEAKELIGGWALMECRDKDEAVEWSKRFLGVLGHGEVRVRPVFGPE